VTSIPKKFSENCLVLVECPCGKVTHDLKLSGDLLTRAYLEANRRRVESAVAWAGASAVGILQHGAPSKEEISPRGCQKMP